jgi:hypothetical protein
VAALRLPPANFRSASGTFLKDQRAFEHFRGYSKKPGKRLFLPYSVSFSEFFRKGEKQQCLQAVLHFGKILRVKLIDRLQNMRKNEERARRHWV